MKYILPLLGALATTILAGLILYPLVSLVFDQFFHLYLFSKPPADQWKNDLVIGAAVVAWFFIACGLGGYVCSLLTDTKEDFAILLYVVLFLVIATVVTRGEIVRDWNPFILVLLAAIIGGACTGNLIAIRMKRRKLRNNPPSPAEQP